MTKEELKIKLTEAQEKIEQLQNDVDYWVREYNDMEEKADKLENKLEEYEGSSIKNIDNFTKRLKLNNLSTPELEDFIELYIRFYNN